MPSTWSQMSDLSVRAGFSWPGAPGTIRLARMVLPLQTGRATIDLCVRCGLSVTALTDSSGCRIVSPFTSARASLPGSPWS